MGGSARNPKKAAARSGRRPRRFALGLLAAALSGWIASTPAPAAGPETPAAPDAAPAEKPASKPAAGPGPAIMIGPTRVTLVDGKTLDGIGVIREAGRIRLVLEDGTEIAFEPSKVASVKALADMDAEERAGPAPRETAAPAAKGTPSRKGAPARQTRSGAGPAKGGATTAAQGGPAAAPGSAMGSPAGTGPAGGSTRASGDAKPPSGTAPGKAASKGGWEPPIPGMPGAAPKTQAGAAAGASSSAKGAAPQAAAAAKGGPGRAGAAPAKPGGASSSRGIGDGLGAGADLAAGSVPGASPPSTTATDTDELARMLDEAIRKQEREAGRADDGAVPADEQGDGTPSEEGEPGAAPGAPPYGEPVPPGSGGPRPEDFDATRPVEGSGIRYLGPGKGPEYPETPPPESDFPKPAARTTTLGYDKDVWKPTSGFKSPATWSKPLPPATSFGNGLSGWGKPVTSFGPRWWAPTPASWPTSLGNGAWTPSDGFAKDQQRRNEMFEKKPESGEEKPADAGQGE